MMWSLQSPVEVPWVKGHSKVTSLLVQVGEAGHQVCSHVLALITLCFSILSSSCLMESLRTMGVLCVGTFGSRTSLTSPGGFQSCQIGLGRYISGPELKLQVPTWSWSLGKILP